MQLHTSTSYLNKLKMKVGENAQSLFYATMVKSKELASLGLCEMKEPEMKKPAEHEGEKRQPKLHVYDWEALIEKLQEYHKKEGPFTQKMAEQKMMEQVKEELKKARERANGKDIEEAFHETFGGGAFHA